MDAGALHLDDNLFARGEPCAVRLRDARGSERCTVDFAKHLVPVFIVFLLDDGEDDGEGEGVRTRLELHQLVTVFGRQKVRAHTHDLPELYKGGTKILEDSAQLRGRQSVHNIVAAQDGDHLAQTQGGIFIFSARQKSREHDRHLLCGIFET